MQKGISRKGLLLAFIVLLIGTISITGNGLKNNTNSEIIIAYYKSTQFLPEGNPYFIMLSDYTDGAGDDNKWALQLRFDSELHLVESEFDNKSLPLVTDQWVEIKIKIDLNNDWMEIYYNGEFLHQKAWSAGPDNQGEGIVNISAVNLFSDSPTSAYFDDFSLEEVGGGVIWSENFDSYENGSSLHGQGGWKGWDNNSDLTAYVTSVESHSAPHSLDILGYTDLVHEYFGNYSGEFVYTAWIYFPENIAPDTPNITGPTNGEVGTEYEYTFVSTDPNEDDVYYYIQWGDGDINEWIGPFPSGEGVTIGHIWNESGEYKIQAKAKDIHDVESKWSEPLILVITNPPSKPTISGQTSGKPKRENVYIFNSVDPDDDDVRYIIDWGDNTSNITDYNSSGTDVKVKHTWSTDGTYNITAKAQDIHGLEGPEATLTVTIPRSRAVNRPLFLRLFERFPLLERVLKLIRTV